MSNAPVSPGGIPPGGPPGSTAGETPAATGKLKRAGGLIAPPARAIPTKNNHRLAIQVIPTRGFMAAVSVFTGTPPPKPLIWKSVSTRSGALTGDLGAEPDGGKFLLSRA
jgi:hypothetical protein